MAITLEYFALKYSCLHQLTGEQFARQFPDSNIAKNFKCGKTKCAYISKFGLAPHFKQLLSKKVSTDDYVLLFDESLNAKTQTKQCDFHVRLWEGDSVASRYFDSLFMGHATAADLKEVFHKSTDELPKAQLLQISMDGPNVNCIFYSKVETSFQNDLGFSLINLGSCGLHIVHNAFQKGVEVTDWQVNSLLKALHQLLKDTPARRDDYAEAIGTEDGPMPLKFCKTRWVENRIVLERALEVLPDMAKYIKAVEMKKFPDPKTKSFDVIKEAVHDPLTTAKMNFVLSVAKEVTPFLTKYQCDKPMVAFLATDLFILLKNLMSRFVKVDILKEVKSIDKLLQVQVNKSSNHVDCSKVNVGFVAERIMKDASEAKKATELQVLEFQMSSKKCLVTIVEKLLQKSPLKYSIVSTIRFLDPRKMASSREQCTKWLKKTLSYLEEKKRVRE